MCTSNQSPPKMLRQSTAFSSSYVHHIHPKCRPASPDWGSLQKPHALSLRLTSATTLRDPQTSAWPPSPPNIPAQTLDPLTLWDPAYGSPSTSTRPQPGLKFASDFYLHVGAPGIKFTALQLLPLSPAVPRSAQTLWHPHPARKTASNAKGTGGPGRAGQPRRPAGAGVFYGTVSRATPAPPRLRTAAPPAPPHPGQSGRGRRRHRRRRPAPLPGPLPTRLSAGCPLPPIALSAPRPAFPARPGGAVRVSRQRVCFPLLQKPLSAECWGLRKRAFSSGSLLGSFPCGRWEKGRGQH